MRSTPESVVSVADQRSGRTPTLVSHSHLGLHGLEVIRLAGLDLSAHPFSGPLLEAADPFVHVHDAVVFWVEMSGELG